MISEPEYEWAEDGVEAFLITPDYPMQDGEALALIREIVARRNHAATIRANADALIKTALDEAERLETNPRLREWAERQLRGRRRSVTTLEGVAGFRKTPRRLVIEDELKAVLHLEQEGCGAAVVKRLDRTALKVTANGDLIYLPTGEGLQGVRGLSVSEAGERFYVKPSTRAIGAAEDAEGDEDA